jgi:hypothetical protein
MLRAISAVAILGIMLGISQGALWAAHPPVFPQEKKEAKEQHPHIRAAFRNCAMRSRNCRQPLTISAATASRPSKRPSTR